MAITAEGARADAALTARFRVASVSLAVSVERSGWCAGPIETSAPLDSSSIEVIPVVKRVAPRVVPVVIMKYGSVMPIGPPMVPAPSITAVDADSEPNSERGVRASIPNAGIWVISDSGNRAAHDCYADDRAVQNSGDAG
jgi:hypothetical protein